MTELQNYECDKNMRENQPHDSPLHDILNSVELCLIELFSAACCSTQVQGWDHQTEMHTLSITHKLGFIIFKT